MTPAEFALRMRAFQIRTAMLPAELERSAQREVLKGIPRTLSVQVARTPAGVKVSLNGRGAAAHARRLRPRLAAGAREAITKVGRP